MFSEVGGLQYFGFVAQRQNLLPEVESGVEVETENGVFVVAFHLLL